MPTAPPTIASDFKAECQAIAKDIDANYDKIVQKYVSGALSGAGIEPRIKLSTLMNLAQKLMIPQVQKFEGGWADNPADSGGPTMRGVITSTFQGLYSEIFINATANAGLSATSSRARALAKKYPGIKSGDRRGEHVKGALYTLCSSEKVAQLFIWSFLCSSLNGYPIAVMAEDAWLGYIQFEMAWGGGPGKVFGGGANYDGVAQKEEFGYNRNKKGTQGWVKWLAEDLGPTKIPGFAMHCFFSHLSFFDKISRPGNKNNVFRKGWFNRLMNWPNSDLNMCIIVNELFNKNVSGMFEFDDKEKEFLTQKAKIYETLILYIPDTI